jgi:hypothetical protein
MPDGPQLELDGFNESLCIAFEHQGKQHYSSVEFFEAKFSFAKRQLYDQWKREACNKHNIKLIEVPEVGTQTKLDALASLISEELRNLGVPFAGVRGSIDYGPAYATNGGTQFLEKLHRYAAERGGACLEAQYLGSRLSHNFVCQMGHRWNTSADSVLRGKWCPRCSALKKAESNKNSIEVLRAVAIERGGKLVSTLYEASNQKVTWECKEGHQWAATYNGVRKGTWCPICAKTSIKELKAIAEHRGGELLSTSCGSAIERLEWRCSAGHVWRANANNIKIGTWCPFCANNRRHTIESVQALASARGGICLSEMYINAREKLLWQCASGHKWEAAPYSVKVGTWCPICAGKRPKEST